MTPLVSVITPTWQRHELLLDRCIPSVRAQTYPAVEHVIMSDGPDPELAALLPEGVVYDALKHHDDSPNNFGSRARNHGLTLASGALIAYLDDDNAFRPEHIATLVEAFVDAGVDFAYSRMHVHWSQDYEIGSAPPQYGQIDTSLIMHRRWLATRWPLPSHIDGDKHAPDWALVAAWLARGGQWAHVPVVTVDYWRSR